MENLGKLRLLPCHDIIILKEVVSANPFQFRDGRGWAEVTENIRVIESMSPNLSSRTVRERTMRLIKYFKNEDSFNLRKSGTEEEYIERDRLLQVASQLLDETTAENARQLQPAERGRLVREQAMQGMDTSGPSTPVNNSEDSGEEEAGVTPPKKRQRKSSSLREDLLALFANKDILDREELEVKKAHIEIEKKKLEMEEKRMKEEREERQQMMQELREDKQRLTQELREDRRQIFSLLERLMSK